MPSPCVIGLDFGTNSARALLVRVADGEHLATEVFPYEMGEAGVLVDPRDPNVARQNPAEYLKGTERTVRGVLAQAKAHGVTPADIVGIGVDTTGSTPIPVDATGRPLALDPAFAGDLAAQAWLWKDHSSHAEAAEITDLARREHPEYLAKCGGAYSSEWFWSKLLRCRRQSPKVFAAAHTWVEHADWMPAVLAGKQAPASLLRGVCAAGHKAMWHPQWKGWPAEDFLAKLHPDMAATRKTMGDLCGVVGDKVGGLCEEWASRLGLPKGTPVSVGAFDAHTGAIGAGVRPGTLVKIMGTSCCDIMVAPLGEGLPDIPGLCGIAVESVIPGHYGLEAGQSAVGDIYNWFVHSVRPAGMDHSALTAQAEKLAPGESGLLALDWHNGNRTILTDPLLTGALLGMTLHTTPAEMFRAWIEATAFGARVILERFEEFGVKVERVVNCGGISARNPMAMQIYADVLGRPIEISGSDQSSALGAAICGAVAAGAHPGFAQAIDAMTSTQPRSYQPVDANRRVYDKLFALYRRLHDSFGLKGAAQPLDDVMKALIAIRDAARSGR